MKRVIALIMTLALAAALSIAVFAAPGDFIESPSGRLDPVLWSAKATDGDNDSPVKLTSYKNRADLDDASRENIEAAYDAIANSDDLAKLHADLAAVAAEYGVKVSDLAVTDLFDISLGVKEELDIEVEAESLDKFAALLRYENGTWTLVDGAKIVDGRLAFITGEFGAFAVVVKTAEGVQAPVDTENLTPNQPVDPNKENASQTGDYIEFAAYAAVISAVVIALVVVITKTRKPAEETK